MVAQVTGLYYFFSPVVGGGGGGVLWYLGFEGLKILGSGIWGVQIFGNWDLRLIHFNILSEIHIFFIYKTGP